MQDYLPPFILCVLLHLRSKNSVSPTKKKSEGELLFTMNGEAFLFCAAFGDEDNFCFFARKDEGWGGHRLGKIDALAAFAVDFHNAVALTNGKFCIPHDASYDGAICRDGRHDFPFGLIDLEGLFLRRMWEEIEGAPRKIYGDIPIIEEL